jgi:hypothetical protein
MPSDEFTKKKEATRKLLGAALCDLVAYIGSTKESFVVGGQYTNDRLIKVFREWLNERRFDIEGSSDLGKVWLDAGKQGIFCPKEGLPPLAPKAPKKPRKEPPRPPTDDSVPDNGCVPPGWKDGKFLQEPLRPPVSPADDDSEPDDGYFKEDAWKPEEDRKDNWTQEGEDWKGDDDDLQTS